jgi:hypothetical protein
MNNDYAIGHETKPTNEKRFKCKWCKEQKTMNEMHKTICNDCIDIIKDIVNEERAD